MSYQPPMISNPEGEDFPRPEHQNYNQHPIQQPAYNAQLYPQSQDNDESAQQHREDIPYYEYREHDDASIQQNERLLEPAKEPQEPPADPNAPEPHYLKYRQPKQKKKVTPHQVRKGKIGQKAEGALVCCACCVAICECALGILEFLSCCMSCCDGK